MVPYRKRPGGFGLFGLGRWGGGCHAAACNMQSTSLRPLSVKHTTLLSGKVMQSSVWRLTCGLVGVVEW